MAKKGSTASKSAPAKTVSKTAAVASTPVRNTPIPKVAAPVRKEITHEMISRRAYEISVSGKGGTELDNWFRAEHELKGL